MSNSPARSTTGLMKSKSPFEAPPRSDHEIVRCAPLRERRLRGRLRASGTMSSMIRFAARRSGACREGVAVRIANMARARILARRHELAANGDDGHARFAINRHPQHSAAGQKADACGRDCFALVHDDFACASLFARFAHVVALLWAARKMPRDRRAFRRLPPCSRFRTSLRRQSSPGRAAPVMMRTHWPACGVPSNTPPAGTSSITSSVMGDSTVAPARSHRRTA